MDFRPAIASVSLGHPTVHSVERRLRAAAEHGFELVEIVDDDLNCCAADLDGGVTDVNTIKAAEHVRSICDHLHLTPFVFQPFRNYEGLLNREKHRKMIQKLRIWMTLVKILGVTMIQIPSNFLAEGTTGDMDYIVEDMLQVAKIGLEQDPIVSFAYEGVAWGEHVDTWQGTWEVVKRVNRSNFGLCLDTYHIAARVWGDPTAKNCKLPDGDGQLRRSMEELVKEVDVEKIFYLQISDAERLEQPLLSSHPYYSAIQHPRMSWSRNARLFAFERNEGGCLPIEPIINAVIGNLKFRGYISMEMFSRELFAEDLEIPTKYAARGIRSWKLLMASLGL